jgi:hypothetical protein|tara:strand:+ start:480 stop:734 length:255 start_codon:yes stop_codon:yes gene_type:complete
MKFVLGIIICSSIYQSCLDPYPLPDLHDSHYECMIAGYNESIKKAKEIGPEEINKYGTIIKFYCKETQVIVPKRKPKLKTSLDI